MRLARELWESGRPGEAGCELYERIPKIHWPGWAVDVLELVALQVSPIPQVQAVLAFARDPEKWRHEHYLLAHQVFDAVRQCSIEHQPPDRLGEAVLILAENVAKVTYNAYGYPAPFDHHAAWKIAQVLQSFANHLDDPEFSVQAWVALGRDNFLMLDWPIICHPTCLCSVA